MLIGLDGLIMMNIHTQMGSRIPWRGVTRPRVDAARAIECLKHSPKHSLAFIPFKALSKIRKKSRNFFGMVFAWSLNHHLK